MNSMKLRDRLKLVRRTFSRPGLTLGELCRRAARSRRVLCNDNISEDTLMRIAQAAAEMVAVDESQFAAFLVYGEDDPSLIAYLVYFQQLQRCARCRGWFEKKEMIPRLSRCKSCHNEERRKPEFKMQLLTVLPQLEQH